MINYIKLNDVGPSAKMSLEFKPRLNILTGDNGLGKTFALDLAWFILTRTWAGSPSRPMRGKEMKPAINYSLWSKSTRAEGTINYDRELQSWKFPQGRPHMPGMVIYARVDGGFSLWDPARNYWKTLAAREFHDPDRPPAFHFTNEQMWAGLEEHGTVYCNGLLRDWITWQFQKTELFDVLSRVLEGLSPHHKELLRPGKPTRDSIVDVRDEPTLEMPYGTIPVTVASAGIRRVLALAYLLVWAWSEHKKASEILQQETTDRLVILIDEVEAHLHPQWQRVILAEVQEVCNTFLTDVFKREVQIIATTHAPLVLASIEARFNPELDQLMTFKPLEEKRDILVVSEDWSKQGDVLGWLVSGAFGLKQARSREAECAIEAAEAFMRGEIGELPEALKTKELIHDELVRVLPGHDPFWPRWIVMGESNT